MSAWRPKALRQVEPVSKLHRKLGWPHLLFLGVGAIVGTGIYTLIGVGAERAGPAIMLSFVIAGAVCALAAMAYAELASMIPDSGGAYAYSQISFGEALAWVVGWSLVLEYAVACAAVGVGWSGYSIRGLAEIGVVLPAAIAGGPHDGGVINLPAMMIIWAVAALLMRGVHESARWNLVLVMIKLAALALFATLAFAAFKSENLTPFAPYGLFANDTGGTTRGMMTAAAIVFFAFFGFDAVATAAEETKRPERDLVIGILGSIALCTVIYVAVSAAAVGALPFQRFAGDSAPLALILRELGHPIAAVLIAGAAIVALPTVILVMLYGLTRVFYAMARDGLLPQMLTRVDARAGAPRTVTVITAGLVSLVAGFLPLGEIAELTNAGTLTAFVAVSLGVLVLRKRYPEAHRGFRYPAAWVLAPLAAGGCIYLLASLPEHTLQRFLIWNLLGAAIYMIYKVARGRAEKASVPKQAAPATEALR